jgi:hypothetical protein
MHFFTKSVILPVKNHSEEGVASGFARDAVSILVVD